MVTPTGCEHVVAVGVKAAEVVAIEEVEAALLAGDERQMRRSPRERVHAGDEQHARRAEIEIACLQLRLVERRERVDDDEVVAGERQLEHAVGPVVDAVAGAVAGGDEDVARSSIDGPCPAIQMPPSRPVGVVAKAASWVSVCAS